jgi:DNA polymerase-3 subunit delta'
MTGSVLVYGSTKEKREEKVLNIISKTFEKDYKSIKMLKRLVDINVIDVPEGKKSIGISATKIGAKWLSEKPFSKKNKILIFTNADLLTVQAQNSLLKTLEEPPSYALIILMSRSENSLLETVISRCKKMNIITSGVAVDTQYSREFNISEMISMDIGKRMEIVNEISKLDSEEIVELIDYWTLVLRDKKSGNPKENLKYYKWILNLVNLKNDIEDTNASVKFGLENLFINS